MSTLREKLISNEELLLRSFPEYYKSINIYLSKLRRLHLDGDLYNFVIASSKSKRNQYFEYNKKGFKSSLDIINQNKENIEFENYTKSSILISGSRYNSMEICSLAKNFNIQVGMYYNEENNILILKSEIGGAPYADGWNKQDKVYVYYLQSENNEANYNTKIFSNNVNKIMYSNVIGEYYCDIHLFCRHNGELEYEYKGLVRPIEMVAKNKAVTLKVLND